MSRTVICKPTCLEITFPWWYYLWIIQAHLPQWPSFSQHILWWCCNPPGILSSTAGILLFNSVFHDGVTPVSVSTLKPPLGVIGVLPLKPQASPILSICHMQVHLSGKLHPRGDATSEPYKPAFHGGHLSRNTSYGGATTLRVFHLPWQRYSYST